MTKEECKIHDTRRLGDSYYFGFKDGYYGFVDDSMIWSKQYWYGLEDGEDKYYHERCREDDEFDEF